MDREYIENSNNLKVNVEGFYEEDYEENNVAECEAKLLENEISLKNIHLGLKLIINPNKYGQDELGQLKDYNQTSNSF